MSAVRSDCSHQSATAEKKIIKVIKAYLLTDKISLSKK